MVARDSELHDSTLDCQIELLGEVMAAAAHVTGRLSQGQLDAALRVNEGNGPPRRGAPNPLPDEVAGSKCHRAVPDDAPGHGG